MDLWSFILSKLHDKKRIILMVVIDNQGSSPGRRGFKMAVSENGSLFGSIGGGLMEYRLVELARKELKQNSKRIFLMHQEHLPDAGGEKSGMICSGNQSIAFYPLNVSIVETIELIAQAKIEKGIVRYSELGIKAIENATIEHSLQSSITSEKVWELEECISKTNTLFIFGAGHVGKALSRIVYELDFRIVFLDDRNKESLCESNSSDQHIHTVDYQNIASLIPEGKHIYVVIMTFGHQSDEIVLQQLLDKKIKYLGLLGSKAKLHSIFSNLLNKGITQQQLDAVHSPIGIPIHSHTPAEIAVSIAAELIAIRNRKHD
ncbi:MAG: XdhC family protein [Prolixibacteraceae bacterium]|jgi:xanthine dehydrogenase accessory factor|nr:XdhC family protein [Prolixibacteraceae bacterium]